jgi:hypothetical protein
LRALISRFYKDTIVDLKVDLIDLVDLDIELGDSGDKRELELKVKLVVIVDLIVDLIVELDVELDVDLVELKVKLKVVNLETC